MEYQTILGLVRQGLMKISSLIANEFALSVDNVYLVIIIVLSLFITTKLTSWLPTVKNSWLIKLLIAGGLFYVIKIL